MMFSIEFICVHHDCMVITSDIGYCYCPTQGEIKEILNLLHKMDGRLLRVEQTLQQLTKLFTASAEKMEAKRSRGEEEEEDEY